MSRVIGNWLTRRIELLIFIPVSFMPHVHGDIIMSEIHEREHDTACASQRKLSQSKPPLRDWNWELIIVSSVLIVFIGLFVVYCSKEHLVCNRCSCETDLILKRTEKLAELEKTVEELKEKGKLTQLGRYICNMQTIFLLMTDGTKLSFHFYTAIAKLQVERAFCLNAMKV